jgi:hypothetical protein
MNDYDPHVSMDLHTTNGTRHAYHLTYAPPLNPATDPAIIELLRKDWLPWVTKAIKDKHGWDYYYYGNAGGGAGRRGLELFDRLRPETARKVIARYMINPDFLRALRQRPRAAS